MGPLRGNRKMRSNVGDTYVLAFKYAPIFPACNEFVKFCTRRMRVSGRNNWDILNCAARGGPAFLTHTIPNASGVMDTPLSLQYNKQNVVVSLSEKDLMDIVSHGLWGSIAFGRKSRSSFWLAFVIGMAPDLFSFGILWLAAVLGLSKKPDLVTAHLRNLGSLNMCIISTMSLIASSYSSPCFS